VLSCYYFFFCALTFAHLAFAAARIRARPAGEIWRFGRAIAPRFDCPLSELKTAMALSRLSRSCRSSLMSSSKFAIGGILTPDEYSLN